MFKGWNVPQKKRVGFQDYLCYLRCKNLNNFTKKTLFSVFLCIKIGI